MSLIGGGCCGRFVFERRNVRFFRETFVFVGRSRGEFRFLGIYWVLIGIFFCVRKEVIAYFGDFLIRFWII